MKFEITDRLREHMHKTGKNIIIVEVASSDSSDFEVSELHIHFTSEKQAKLFEQQKNFHPYPQEWGTLLLPNYLLEYSDVVTFDVKKVLFFHVLTQTGIRL